MSSSVEKVSTADAHDVDVAFLFLQRIVIFQIDLKVNSMTKTSELVAE